MKSARRPKQLTMLAKRMQQEPPRKNGLLVAQTPWIGSQPANLAMTTFPLPTGGRNSAQLAPRTSPQCQTAGWRRILMAIPKLCVPAAELMTVSHRNGWIWNRPVMVSLTSRELASKTIWTRSKPNALLYRLHQQNWKLFFGFIQLWLLECQLCRQSKTTTRYYRLYRATTYLFICPFWTLQPLLCFSWCSFGPFSYSSRPQHPPPQTHSYYF